MSREPLASGVTFLEDSPSRIVATHQGRTWIWEPNAVGPWPCRQWHEKHTNKLAGVERVLILGLALARHRGESEDNYPYARRGN